MYEALLKVDPLVPIELQHVICGADGRIISLADFSFAQIKYADYCDGNQRHLVEDHWQRDLRQRNQLTENG